MWILFGGSAMLAALVNVIFTMQGKEAKWFRYLSMALTALTLCAFYQDSARMIEIGAWSALEDVVPSTSGVLWVLTGLSILINGVSLFKK